MGGDASKEAIACCDCGFQQRNQILEATEVNGVSSMKLHENNQRFLRAMAEGGKSDLILGLFSTTREFDVNAVDENGEAALHKAARNGHVIVCHVLIKRGARADLQNNDGKTAVDLARDNNHMECVEYLQEPGNKNVTKKKTLSNGTDAGDVVAGEPIEALYDYTASPDIPFHPDTRSELSMKRGDTFYLIYKRPEDGWCLVRTPSTIPGGAVEGWVPGNFVSKDGKRALVETSR